MPSQGYRGVADRAVQGRRVCRGIFCTWRTDWETQSRETLHGLSLPSAWMEQLEREGLLECP